MDQGNIMTSYKYQPLDGYRFICNVFAVISRDREVKKIFNDNLKDTAKTTNNETVMTLLSEKWTKFSSVIIKKDTEIIAGLMGHFQEFHSQKNEEGRFSLSNYEKDWKRTAEDIVVNRIETMDSKVALGIATVISTAMLHHSDRYFYIGRDEAKKILFLCLGYYGYQDIEYIPDKYFDETENLRKLLFSALYSTLLLLCPTKEGYTRDKNYESGAKIIIRIIESNIDSQLYEAFQRAAEAKSVADQLWAHSDIDHQYLDMEYMGKLPLSKYYIVPTIENETNIGVLSCEKGQAIRSLVEGKSGCGKSTLAKIIALICQTDGNGSDQYNKIVSCLDFRQRMWPISVYCRLLKPTDLERGIIYCGLNQMWDAISSEKRLNSYHFRECEEYINAFCNHKIMQEELLLIIDDYSKVPADCIELFNRQLKQLCQENYLHIIIITDKLKPSSLLRLSSSFNRFSMDSIYANPTYVASILGERKAINKENITMDIVVQNYVNTPRRLLRYIQSLDNGENILDVIESCLEEELNIKKCFIEYRDEYPEFFKTLTLHALKGRDREDRKINRLVITDKHVKDVLNKNSHWAKIWSYIENETIMLDYCDGVACKEYGTRVYLYSILADYYFEILKSETLWKCAGRLTEEFSYLSGVEFSFVLWMLFNKLYKEAFTSISEEKAICFFKVVIGRLFELDTVYDLEHYQWAVECIVKDEYRDAFVYGGDIMRREKAWNMLSRIEVVFFDCMDKIKAASSLES